MNKRTTRAPPGSATGLKLRLRIEMFIGHLTKLMVFQFLFANHNLSEI